MKELYIKDFSINPFTLIGKEWMLITATHNGKTNTMTASWGGMGVMWNKNVAFIVIRPTRYTKQFVDNAEGFSLTFYAPQYHDKLAYLGTVSGRDEDKIAKAEFNIIYEGNIPYFSQCKTAIFCKKLYAQNFKKDCFIDQELNDKIYQRKDWHTMYIGEIEKILVAE